MLKSIRKRFKFTKNGKILRRFSGINHYLGKKSGNAIRRKRKFIHLSKSTFKNIKKLTG